MSAVPERRDEIRFDIANDDCADNRSEQKVREDVAFYIDSLPFTIYDLLEVPECDAEKIHKNFREVVANAIDLDDASHYEALGRLVADIALESCRESSL